MAQSEPLCALSFFQSCTSCKSCQSFLLPQRINYPTADRIHKIYKIKRGLSCGPVCVVLCVFVNSRCLCGEVFPSHFTTRHGASTEEPKLGLPFFFRRFTIHHLRFTIYAYAFRP